MGHQHQILQRHLHLKNSKRNQIHQRLDKKKEGYNFDIVCCHDWLSSIAGLVIKNEIKIPVVFHTHSTEWGRSGGQGSEVVSHFENAMAQNSDKIITVSYAMQADLLKHGWPPGKISVVWNGVDPERYDQLMFKNKM